jgi:hypothetical protein
MSRSSASVKVGDFFGGTRSFTPLKDFLAIYIDATQGK